MCFQKQIINLISIAALLIFFFSPLLLARQNLNEETVIAEIQGESLRVKDVEDKKINDLRKRLYAALSQKIKLRAIKELAKTHKEFQVNPIIKISDKKIRDFYKLNKITSRGSFEEFAPRIRQYMEAQQRSAYVEAQFQRAVLKGLVKPLLHEPKDLLLEVPVETAYIFGKDNLKVMLLEFSDYQCPFCFRVQGTLNELREQYRDRVTFGYRHLPLPFHTEADEAAIAVECVRDQGKFEEYHKVLFKNQKKQFNQDLKKYAKSVAVADQKKFEQCLDSEQYRSRVVHDIEVASSFGMNGTPSFAIGVYDSKNKVIRGEILSGALPKDVFISTIEKHLKK